MSIANVEMAKVWDGDEGAHWTEQAHRYEAVSPALTQALFDRAAIQPAARVLDVGCGTGVATMTAARKAPDGDVLGVDLSGQMLGRARAQAKDAGLTNVEFVQADAQVHPFEADSRDLVISTFGVMFFADPVAAFANIGRAVVPGGRLVAVVWQPIERNEWLVAMRNALAVGRQLPTPPPGMPGPFGLAEPDFVQKTLTAAGWRDVNLEPVVNQLRYGSDADDAWSFIRTMGVVKGLTEGLEDDAREQALSNLRQLVDEKAGADGVVFNGATWLVTASRP